MPSWQQKQQTLLLASIVHLPDLKATRQRDGIPLIVQAGKYLCSHRSLWKAHHAMVGILDNLAAVFPHRLFRFSNHGWRLQLIQWDRRHKTPGGMRAFLFVSFHDVVVDL